MSKVIFPTFYLIFFFLQLNGQVLVHQFLSTEYMAPIHSILNENSLFLGASNNDPGWKITRYNSSGESVDEFISSLETSMLYFDFIDENKFMVVSKDGKIYLNESENSDELILIDSLYYEFGNEHRVSKAFRKGNEIIIFGTSVLDLGSPPHDVWYHTARHFEIKR